MGNEGGSLPINQEIILHNNTRSNEPSPIKRVEESKIQSPPGSHEKEPYNVQIPKMPSIISDQMLRKDSLQNMPSKDSIQIGKSNFSQNSILQPNQGAGFQRINSSVLKD